MNTPGRVRSRHQALAAQLRTRARRRQPAADDQPLGRRVFATPPQEDAFGGKVLTSRLTRCGREREQMPNIIAVDYYEQSGVVEATDALNRVALRRR